MSEIRKEQVTIYGFFGLLFTAYFAFMTCTGKVELARIGMLVERIIKP